MKKFLAAVLIVLAALALCACGENEVKNDGGDDGGAKVSAPSAPAGGYIFESNGAKIEIDAKMADIEKELGEPKSYFESPSCAFGDLDKVYTYNGFRIDTYQIDGVDYVYDIVFMDDTVKTPEGAYIGDTVDTIKGFYGEPASEDDKSLVYEDGNMKLVFLLSDGSVSTIEYLSKVISE